MILMTPLEYLIAPLSCIFCATSVTEVRLTPSISARNSCVRSESVTLGTVPCLQQPPAEPLFDLVQRIAGGGDPRLPEQEFIVSNAKVGDRAC